MELEKQELEELQGNYDEEEGNEDEIDENETENLDNGPREEFKQIENK